MAAYPIRAAWFGFPAGGTHSGPAVSTGGTNAGAVVGVKFDEPIRTVPIPTLSQFTATVAGVARTINSVGVVGNNTLSFTLASAPTAGQAVVITYTQGTAGTGRLASASGEEVPSGVIASFSAV